MIDVKDLPVPVARAVAEFDGLEDGAALLRFEAEGRLTAAHACFSACEWGATAHLLALAIGYLTAADRAEEAA